MSILRSDIEISSLYCVLHSTR